MFHILEYTDFPASVGKRREYLYNFFVKLKTIKNIYFTWIPNLLILLGIGVLLFPFAPVIRDEIWYFWKEKLGHIYKIVANKPEEPVSLFASLLGDTPSPLYPVDRNFSIVIEKIGVNAPIVKDVSVIDSNSYKESLKQGVAHSNTSSYPSNEPGNTYLFAHASVNFWDLGKYATVFNLIRKLEIKDSISIFYEGKQYIYKVVNKEVYPGWNTYPLSRAVIEPVLTIQTCDPPGTTLNRMVVTATLESVVE